MIAIIGGGPCGLGAAWRFQQLGFQDFQIFEAQDFVGGLATSFVDPQGFTWDIGGHVQFSHYEDFDDAMDRALPDGWYYHERQAWVWICDRFVPYPFQNNLWRLPKDLQQKCIEGLEELSPLSQPPKHFGQWIDHSFGSGLAEVFMRPYNFKVWAYPPESMDYKWIGERVATVDLNRLKENIANQKDDVSWGPNNKFRYPKKGGTGAIWKSIGEKIGSSHIRTGSQVERIDPENKTLHLADGESVSYDRCLSTIPIPQLSKISGIDCDRNYLYSNSHIIGIGLKGKLPERLNKKCWIYFPEENSPFYRVTVFSNYSPANVPDSGEYWSLMCEVSESPKKPVQEESLVEDCIQGLVNTQMIQASDEIVSKWKFAAKPGYPTPFLGRDSFIDGFLDRCKKHEIYTRGRFGLWRYEVSNQDHTFMQGFEWADWLVNGKTEITAFRPNEINKQGKQPRR